MESWSYISGGKGFVCDESVATPDLGIGRNKIGSLGWEFKAPFSPGSNMVMVSQNQEGNENQGFGELGFPPIIKNSAASGSIRDILGNKLGFGTMFNPGLAAQTAVSEEDESSSKLSSSVVESNSWDSALIDLKLGGLSDVQTFNYFKSSPNNYLSSAQLSVPSKRTKMVGCSSATPFCQVYGCKKNLSSSKDYHKRHKVCEVHSKTAKVIVNGIEQRFCQQCSRFHLLAEFDDGKRSCRKRLAGHNERRRKPHVGVHSTRPGRFLKSYNHSMKEGSRESTIAPSSFIFQDRLPTNFSNPYQQKYERNEWCHIKLEDRTTHDLQSLSSITDEPLHSKSLYASAFGRHYPSLQANGVNTAVGNIFNCSSNGNRYAHDIDASNFVMHSLFQSSSVSGGKEDFFILDSASTGQPQLAIASETGCALSLLSSQSQTTRTPVTHSLLSPGNQTSHSHYGVTQIPEIDNPFGASPQASVTGLSTNMCPSGVGSVEASRLDPILMSDGSDEANYDIDGMFYGSKYVHSRNPVSCDDGSTIDLLKLSSQLQRVEHQKQGFRVKQENDSRFRLRIT